MQIDHTLFCYIKPLHINSIVFFFVHLGTGPRRGGNHHAAHGAAVQDSARERAEAQARHHGVEGNHRRHEPGHQERQGEQRVSIYSLRGKGMWGVILKVVGFFGFILWPRTFSYFYRFFVNFVITIFYVSVFVLFSPSQFLVINPSRQKWAKLRQQLRALQCKYF